MQYLDLTLTTLAENLALDEALLLEAEAGRSGEILRFWEWPTSSSVPISPGGRGQGEGAAVILGAGSRLAEDVDEAACQADDVPVFRRSSGGGTVLLGSGCLCYSLILSFDHEPALREIHSSFRFILGRIRDALDHISHELEVRSDESQQPLISHSSLITHHSSLDLAGISDLAVGGKKCSGNSQQRKRRYLLHHGTILYAFDTRLVDRYLLMPGRQPEYRRQRKHSEFLTNLPADLCDFKLKLRTAWNANSMISAWPQDAARQLAQTKYTRPEWIRRR